MVWVGIYRPWFSPRFKAGIKTLVKCKVLGWLQTMVSFNYIGWCTYLGLVQGSDSNSASEQCYNTNAINSHLHGAERVHILCTSPIIGCCSYIYRLFKLKAVLVYRWQWYHHPCNLQMWTCWTGAHLGTWSRTVSIQWQADSCSRQLVPRDKPSLWTQPPSDKRWTQPPSDNQWRRGIRCDRTCSIQHQQSCKYCVHRLPLSFGQNYRSMWYEIRNIFTDIPNIYYFFDEISFSEPDYLWVLTYNSVPVYLVNILCLFNHVSYCTITFTTNKRRVF